MEIKVHFSSNFPGHFSDFSMTALNFEKDVARKGLYTMTNWGSMGTVSPQAGPGQSPSGIENLRQHTVTNYVI